jgi:hypothetical protein
MPFETACSAHTISCEVLEVLMKQTEAERTSLYLVQRQALAYGRQA